MKLGIKVRVQIEAKHGKVLSQANKQIKPVIFSNLNKYAFLMHDPCPFLLPAEVNP